MNAAASLAQLQEMLQAHVLGGDGAIAAAIAARGGIGVERRLAIYHGAYRARLVDTLRDTFGHTSAFLGEAFDGLARRYVEEHRSSHPSLRWYGLEFPAWLSHAAREQPVLAEMAALDLALRRAFDCADAPALTLAAMAAIEPEAWGRAVFLLSPSYERLRFRHNALALWQALDEDASPPPPAPLAQPGEVLVWRRGLQPHFRSLGALEASALDHVRSGLDFAALCARLAEDFPETDVASEAGRLLRRWIEEALLSGLASVGTR